MSDLLLHPGHARETRVDSFGDEANPIGLDGVEFVEFQAARPQALGQVLEMMGFRPVARHRSREVLLYRQGGVNIVVNAHVPEGGEALPSREQPWLSAIALRVRDARAAYRHVLDRGAWEAPTQPEAMELHIPAIHGVGGTRIHFVDRWRDFSIYDVDFVPIPSVDPHPPPVAGIHFFGIVQYIGAFRSNDWIEFYSELFGMQAIPDEQRFGIMPSGKLLRAPGLSPEGGFMLQLVEPPADAEEAQVKGERLQRIGLGVPDVHAAVAALRALGMEFVETKATHTERRGALTKTYLGHVVFELVHSDRPIAVPG